MFHDSFENIDDIKRAYEITDDDLEGVEILYASYQTGVYDGSSLVLFKKDGKLFIVEGTHCSCHGLENQWDPVKTDEKTLKREIDAKSRHLYKEFQSFIEFCKGYFGWK